MVLEVIVEPSGHRKKCVTALPSSIPRYCAIRHTSGVIVVTSFVTKNLILFRISRKKCIYFIRFYRLMIFQFIKNIIFALMVNSCCLRSFPLHSTSNEI